MVHAAVVAIAVVSTVAVVVAVVAPDSIVSDAGRSFLTGSAGRKTERTAADGAGVHSDLAASYCSCFATTPILTPGKMMR